MSYSATTGDWSLVGKRAIVTGAARGLSASIAEALVGAGSAVCLMDLDQDGLRETASRLERSGGTVISHVADLTTEPSRSVAHAVSWLGGLDIIVNGAGAVRFGALDAIPGSDWDLMLDVNLRVTLEMCKASAPHLRASGGSIVNIVSIAGGRGPYSGNAAYTVSKAALSSLTQQIALEWGHHGIRCNGINPGLTNWRMRGLPPDPDKDRRRAELVPLGRLATPRDIAAVALFLASDASSYVTGQIIDVDGGFMLTTMSQLLS